MNTLYHYGMNVPYESTGRIKQKARTRDALIVAARGAPLPGAVPRRSRRRRSLPRYPARRRIDTSPISARCSLPRIRTSKNDRCSARNLPRTSSRGSRSLQRTRRAGFSPTNGRCARFCDSPSTATRPNGHSCRCIGACGSAGSKMPSHLCESGYPSRSCCGSPTASARCWASRHWSGSRTSPG